MDRYGTPEIFNTDPPGSQFTRFAFIGRLQAAGIRISMDGSGRGMDNLFIARLCRSLEYEAIYLHEIADSFTVRCPTRTSTCRNLETISSALCRLFAIYDPPFS